MEYFSNEFFLIALTFGTYFLGKLLRRWTGWVVMNPILVSICCLIVFLKVTGVSYDTYNQSGKMIEFCCCGAWCASLYAALYDKEAAHADTSLRVYRMRSRYRVCSIYR